MLFSVNVCVSFLNPNKDCFYLKKKTIFNMYNFFFYKLLEFKRLVVYLGYYSIHLAFIIYNFAFFNFYFWLLYCIWIVFFCFFVLGKQL